MTTYQHGLVCGIELLFHTILGGVAPEQRTFLKQRTIRDWTRPYGRHGFSATRPCQSLASAPKPTTGFFYGEVLP